MKPVLLAGAMVLIASLAFAQTPTFLGADLSTPIGHEANVSLGGYIYTEPDAPSISIHGVKFGGEYTGTLAINRRAHWFAQANVRGLSGSVTYDGWCSPFILEPNADSPNGYAVTLGDRSACSASGDKDWYVETRGLIGKDLMGRTWGWSPYTGLGFRHLSNGTTGVPGYRTEDYLYLPVGLTARTRVGSRGALGFTLEYDYLIQGWQTTRNSALGGGDVPPTDTLPGFTIEGFSDFSFDQHGGWGLRASAKYQFAGRWSVEPYYLHWSVSDSPVTYGTLAFTVNGVTAYERFGAYEPYNVTREGGVKLGFRF
jgi:hypothetical protein